LGGGHGLGRVEGDSFCKPRFETWHTVHTQPPECTLSAWFGGLYGVDSPLPMYFDEVLDRETPGATNLKRLLTLVGNRFYHLLYEVWSRMAPMFCSEKALEDYVRKPVLSICGLGHLRRARINVLAGAAYLVQGMPNRWGLASMLGYFLQVPVDVRQFDAARVPLRDGDKTRLGNPNTAVLGKSFRATDYRKTFATHIRIICGPLDREQYLSLLPGGELHAVLTYLTHRYLPIDLEYRIELVLAAHAVKGMHFRLARGWLRLGATTVLGAERLVRTIRILREGVSPASNPEELHEIIEFIESTGQADAPGARNRNHGETESSLKSA